MVIKKLIYLLTLTNVLALASFARTEACDCICPNVEVRTEKEVYRKGSLILFEAVIPTGKDPKFLPSASFQWTVSAGSIVSGQGTTRINVDTAGVDAASVTATVRIGGYCAACEKTSFRGITRVIAAPKPVLSNEFVHGNCGSLQANLDAFVNELSNDPTARGHIQLYGSERAMRRAERQIRGWIGFRKLDPNRFMIIRVGGNAARARIELWRVPAGAENPPPGEPEMGEPNKSEPVPVKGKAFLFAERSVNDVGGCEDFDVEAFGEAILASARNRGRIVIRAESLAEFRIEEKEILDHLAALRVPRTRLTTVFVKVRPNRLLQGEQLWLLPR